MNAQEMLDYALGQLESPALGRFEQELAADPAAMARLDRLTRSIDRLADDGETFAVPPDLAGRTARLVMEAKRPKRSVLDFVPVSVPFRWADVAVAAGIFVAGLLTLVPAVSRSRDRMDQAGCVYNLQQLGRALWQYGNLYHHYPTGPKEHPSAPTGSYAVILHDSGVLLDLDSLNCPCTQTPKSQRTLPTLKTVCDLHETDPARCVEMIHTDYAYNVGHRDPAGRVIPVTADHNPTTPLLADQPNHDAMSRILPGNSLNHGGRGQNVLYTDLHVGWHNTRLLGPMADDMFLNNDNRPAPGLHQNDAALLPSPIPFDGR